MPLSFKLQVELARNLKTKYLVEQLAKTCEKYQRHEENHILVELQEWTLLLNIHLIIKRVGYEKFQSEIGRYELMVMGYNASKN